MRGARARPFLTDEQRVMVVRLTRDGDGVAVVVGRAGAGKTTALAAARDAWEAGRRPGASAARSPAGPPTNSSDRAGITATSVAAPSSARPRAAPAGTVAARRRGQHARHPPVRRAARRASKPRKASSSSPATPPAAAIEAGGALDALATRLDPIVLKRQPPPARSLGARRRRPASATAPLNARSTLYERTADCTSARPTTRSMHALVDRLAPTDDPDDTLMIAHCRADVAELNGRARAVLQGDRDSSVTTSSWRRAAVRRRRPVIVAQLRRLDVRNGDRGVVTGRPGTPARSGPARRPQRRARRAFLAAARATGRPPLEHGYAIDRARRPRQHMPAHARARPRRRVPRVGLQRDRAPPTAATSSSSRTPAATATSSRPRAGSRRRVVLAAALARKRADELAIERLFPSRERAFGSLAAGERPLRGDEWHEVLEEVEPRLHKQP